MSKPQLPELVLVTGAPGSGKTVLAKQLAEKMRFKYVDSDAVLEDFRHASKPEDNYDREKIGIPKFFKLIETALVSGENVVTDPVGHKGRDESDFARLAKASKVVIVHCRADNVHERFYKRELGPDGKEPDWLGPHMKDLEKNHLLDVDPLEVSIPVVEVDTNDGYKPDLDELVSTITKYKTES